MTIHAPAAVRREHNLKTPFTLNNNKDKNYNKQAKTT